jgi:hypothetical protein
VLVESLLIAPNLLIAPEFLRVGMVHRIMRLVTGGDKKIEEDKKIRR